MKKHSTRTIVRSVALAALMTFNGVARADEPAPKVHEAVVEKFGKLDRNGAKQLSVDEFRAWYSAAQMGVALRDFDLVDRNADGQLSLEEYWSLVADFDGGDQRNLGLGVMPTWSKDGRQLSYSHNGIQVMNADGTKSRSLTGGWGAQWSPTGKRIAYYAGLRYLVLEVATEKTTVLYDATEYRQIFWNFTWSPDSQRIC